MKRLMILTIILLSLKISLFAQDISVGGGMAFGSGFSYQSDPLNGTTADSYNSGNIGLFAMGRYKLGSPVTIALSCLYTIPARYKGSIADVDYSHTISSVIADMNVNYIILEGGMADIYGIGGVNLHFVGYKYSEEYMDVNSGEEVIFKTRQSDNFIGLNIGAGATSGIGEHISILAEAKYVISYYGQFVLSIGVAFDM